MVYKIVNTVTTVVEKVETQEVEVTLMQFIGLKAKAQRELLGLKQIDVSRRSTDDTGVPALSAGSISYIEAGSGNSSLSSLEALAKALNLHISELFPVKENSEIC